MRPYGEVNLDMAARLDLAAAMLPGPAPQEPSPRTTQQRLEPGPKLTAKGGRRSACPSG